MRSHAKASTAGPNSGWGVSSRSPRHRSAVLACVLSFLATACLLPASALAAGEHHFLETFGSSAQPSFTEASGMAVDQSTGDLLVIDSGAGTLSRYHANGTPANFSALGSNEITGFSFGSPTEVQVAVDNSGGPTKGDIYVVQGSGGVKIFDEDGNPLSELTESSEGPFEFPCGVAVDPSGNVYVADFSEHIHKYEPGANPPVKGDNSDNFHFTFGCTLAAGAGSTNGFIFAAHYAESVWKLDSGTGEEKYEVAPNINTTVNVDPSSGHVYVAKGEELVEYDASGASSASEVSATALASPARGVAVNGTSGNVYATREGGAKVEVFGPLVNPPTVTTNPATTIHHTSAVLNGHLDPGGDPGITDCHFEWGTTTAYGNTAPCNEGNSFNSAADVSANLSFLTPGTEIHFRLDISTTASGDFHGEDQSFTPDPFPSTHSLITSFGPDGTPATSFLTFPLGLAFHQSSEKLYAIGGESFSASPGEIFGFDASAPPSYPALPGFAPLSTAPLGNGGSLAVDNTALGSAGNIYFASTECCGGTGLIYGFDSAGAALGGNFPINPGSPSFICGAAVDSAGNLWVSNSQTKQILEYSSAGVFQSSVDVSAVGFPCKGLVFDSADNLYVAGYNEVRKYTAASGYTTSSQIVSQSNSDIQAIAVDPSTGTLYVLGSAKIGEYAPSGTLLSEFAPKIENSQHFDAITVDATNHYVYVDESDFNFEAGHGEYKILAFDSVTQKLPTLTPGTPTAITDTSATLNAKVDPEGVNVTDCHFEWGTTASYGQTAPCTPAPGAGSGDVAVSADISGLKGGTTYHFRIVASNANGTSRGGDQTFLAHGPTIVSQSVEDVSFSDATLSAKINPRGDETTYHVEYGTTSAYGQSTPESTPIGFAGDESEHTVSVHIGGLDVGTAYHFRFVAVNADGTSQGPDRTFATYSVPPALGPCPNDQLRSGPGARLPDCRAYEQATPVDKHGANIQGTEGDVQASSAGDRVIFYLNGGLPESVGSSQLSSYMASRGANAWSSTGLLPPTDPGVQAEVIGWNEDLSTAVTTSPHPGNVDEDLLLRDSASGAFQLNISASTSLAEVRLAGFAADPSHLIFENKYPLLPEAAAGKANLYDLDHGNLTLVGRIPAGAATSCDDESGPACVPAPGGSFAGPEGGASNKYYTQNAISRDGTKVFFTAAGTGQLYVRENGTATTRISPSEGFFVAATADGSKAFFTDQGDLYSYEVDSGQLTNLTASGDVQGVLGISDDGSYAYYVVAGSGNLYDLYVSHNGTTTYIASLQGADADDWKSNFGSAPNEELKQSRVSADGHALLFSSHRSLTGYDNEGSREFFRYSAPDESLTCVSCNPTGQHSGGAALGTEIYFTHSAPNFLILARNLSADGKQVFFQSSEPLLASDINGVTDVYEWEAKGSGSCESESQNGGCLYLISSGTSSAPTAFADASANGKDAFIFTSQPLVPSDGDQLIDIYDASVGGGLPSQHPLSPPTCNSTACQSNPAPPPEQTPASASFSGPGNAHEGAKARGCPKGKRKVRHAGKVRCHKAHKQHKRHNNRGGSK